MTQRRARGKQATQGLRGAQEKARAKASTIPANRKAPHRKGAPVTKGVVKDPEAGTAQGMRMWTGLQKSSSAGTAPAVDKAPILRDPPQVKAKAEPLHLNPTQAAGGVGAATSKMPGRDLTVMLAPSMKVICLQWIVKPVSSWKSQNGCCANGQKIPLRSNPLSPANPDKGISSMEKARPRRMIFSQFHLR